MQSVFTIKTVQGTTVIVTPQCIESVATSDTGCALYMQSGAIWHISETPDMFIDRLLKWGSPASFGEDVQ